MSIYLITGGITFIFTTILAIAGVGAAFILIPVFVSLKVPLLTAMATALLLNSISMCVVSYYNAKNKLIIYKTAIPILLTAMITAHIGGIVSAYVPRNILLWLFVGFLFFAGSLMLWYKPPKTVRQVSSKKLVGYGIGVGMIAGFVGGLLGVGGGSLIAPSLTYLGFNPKNVSATTSFIVIFSSLGGFLGHVCTGHIDHLLLIFCGTASICGAVLGNYLMRKKLTAPQVKKVIGIVLYLMAFKILWNLLHH